MGLYELEKNKVLKMAPQLTKDHIFPTHGQKMRVGLAVQTLSHRTAAAIRSSAESLTPTATQTAELVNMFNATFDFLNSSNLRECGTRRPAMKQLWSSQKSVRNIFMAV